MIETLNDVDANKFIDIHIYLADILSSSEIKKNEGTFLML